MNTKFFICAAGAAMLSATTAAAQAQRPAQPAAAPAARPAQAAPAQATQQALRPANPGPAIAGVCTLDEQRAVTGSAAGQAYTARMRTLAQQVEAELRPQETALNNETRTYQGQRASLPEAQRQTRDQALQTRIRTFQTLAETRERELQATQQRQLGRIVQAIQPIVAQVYSARGCGIMINQNAVVYANPAMDVTATVIQQLNARLPTLTFERERIQAAPAATPATPAR